MSFVTFNIVNSVLHAIGRRSKNINVLIFQGHEDHATIVWATGPFDYYVAPKASKIFVNSTLIKMIISSRFKKRHLFLEKTHHLSEEL